MYFDDLTEYSYSQRHARPGLLNVGWLDVEHEFPTMVPSRELVESLWHFREWRIATMRGYHSCEFCEPESDDITITRFHGEEVRLGFAEIRAFSRTGEAFAAPDLIFHYVAVHHYAPPAQFVDAIVKGPKPGSAEYELLLDKFLEDEDRLYCRRGS
ncbi:hypothetical protein [Nannocystis pusilla]|uniref:DUF7919 family protein n=1 Tax=Nannocystis pusilla TaxID=889268 RepID=UPI003DA1CB10